MTITTPLALLLLAILIPVIVYVGYPRTRFRRGRDAASLVLRIMIVTLVVLALSGVQISQSADRLAVVFLVDVSDSMGSTAQEEAYDFIRQSLPEMRPDDLAGIVAFGADAQVARSMSAARELGPVRSTPATGNTNLAAAIRLGLALFPEGAARRMVVLSDGQPTIGDTEGAAQLASAADVEISFVQYTRPPEPEIQVKNVETPTVLDENQEFDMTITIASEEATRAVATILASGEIVSRQEVDLREGTNNYTLRLRSGSAGFRDFLVQVDPLGADGFYQNNALGAFSRVQGAPRVLVVSGGSDVDETQFIIPALRESGLEVDLATPSGLPIGVATLAQYESVVLVNVSATDLTNARMQTLDTYVSDLGGGLVVIGGPQTYGPGGYYQTPLEDALPVEVQIRDQQRLPQLTIAYVIDRSGSMGAVGDSGIPNIDLAKEAIIRSIDFLQPTDRAGVASFDTDAFWIAEFQDVVDRVNLQRQVATLRSSGGTNIMSGMRLVAQDIMQEPAQLKHIILLTDGGASPEGLVELTEDLNRNAGVTTSVISIGEFEANFLQQMAEVGQGNYHNVHDAESIPQIFTQETVLAQRSYIQEQTFTPVLTANHPIMDGIRALPSLEGYVATSSRAAAQVILRGPEPYSDPVLAAWQYGLGRSVAFMSDATARWGQNWVTWDEFARFWSQTVRWTITEGASSNLETRIVMEDEQARITVDARDNDGAFLNGLDLQTSVVFNPARSAQRIALRQVAPGQYEGVFTPEAEGAYFLRVTNQNDAPNVDDGETLELNQTTGWVMSYSPEYDLREFDDELLQSIADLTEGKDLANRSGDVFEHNITAQNATTPLWPWLLLVAALLLPFDVGVRRLLVTRSDLQRLTANIRGKFGRAGRLTETQAERISSLRQARERARQSIEGGAISGESTGKSPTGAVSALRKKSAESHDPQKPLPPEPIRPAPDKPAPPKPPTKPTPAGVAERMDTGNIGSKLLKRKRDRENE